MVTDLSNLCTSLVRIVVRCIDRLAYQPEAHIETGTSHDSCFSVNPASGR
jgi:hypothetical protein